MGRVSKREDILRAGVELLHKRGYGVASVESISEAAGVPKGSFFNHFHTKEQFAGEALNAYFLPWTQKSDAILARPDLSSTEKLLALLEIATGKARGCYDGCMIGNLSLELAHQSEPVRTLLVSILSAWTSSFERVIREGQASGEFAASLVPDKTARFIVNLFQGAILRAKVDRSDQATDEFQDMVLATVTTHRNH